MTYLIEFKIMFINFLTKIRKTMHGYSDNFNSEKENTETTELKNIIIEIKN